MNAVEIEQAISDLCAAEFDAVEFPFQFLEAFGEKATTIKRLRPGKNSTNKSDLTGGLLQRNNIHLLVSDPGQVNTDLQRLTSSPETTKQKAKFALATDGEFIEAENLVDGETLACTFAELPYKFGFFLVLAGIATVKQIRDNAFDIKATGRMNRLYVELQKNNPDWDTDERREELNHFFARLIFCFFAEDTGIFPQDDLFTGTVQQMSESDGSNTHEVIGEIFRAMNIPREDRDKADLPPYAATMPYVNGGLFEGSTDCPTFTKIARSYLIHIGGLDWTKINPDIFGSMIQAVAEDQERGELGMHYTSVPNILKVLNPLFLDELRQQLKNAGDSKRKLLNLRNRMARIRVFDPACGSGNFLVVAYKEMREIEAEINRRRAEADRASDIPLTNFRGIEIRSFAAEVARLALVIAQFQCDLEYRGQQLALSHALPLSTSNWITCGNALRIDWNHLIPREGKAVRITANDLYSTPQEQQEVDFENEGGETFICGNPPYIGTKYQSKSDKEDLDAVFDGDQLKRGNADYVFGWIRVSSELVASENVRAFGFVTTNSVFQGEQAEILLWHLKSFALSIEHAHTSFKWSNNAAKNAGVTCCITKICTSHNCKKPTICTGDEIRDATQIGPYLIDTPHLLAVTKSSCPIFGLQGLDYGSMANDGGHLMLSHSEYRTAVMALESNPEILRRAVGGSDFIRGNVRYTVYVPDKYTLTSDQESYFRTQFDAVRTHRLNSRRPATQKLAEVSHRYAEQRHVDGIRLFIPQTLSEKRQYITAGLLDQSSLAIAPHMQMLDADGLHLAIACSRLHAVWVSAVCGRMKTDIRYSNTLGWNTFPVPSLGRQNIADLKSSGYLVLIARESYWPATIADMYDPDRMDAEFPRLREAHDHNDEALERIYIGRRFKNDTERLEKLFEMYAAATEKEASA